MKVLFVCLGNICRSPTAEAVFRSVVEEAGLTSVIEIDSCGTAGYHVGEAPDSRSMAAAASRGYDMARLRGRQLSVNDYLAFDYILAMDEANMTEVTQGDPGESGAVFNLFLSYSNQKQYIGVPDPYYGGKDGFGLVLDLVEDAAIGLLGEIKKRL
ncbi:phosphotyrosine protein phosphatase [Gammaproteobacteria bacterium 45_16_T64]|nr:phosphotyrosine protein phosphatase [Gammaproteobacteria bacterium 45_16_T64]